MPQFVSIVGGWVNLAHVARIAESEGPPAWPGGPRSEVLTYYGPTGEKLGTKTGHNNWPPFDYSDVIPAAAGVEAVVVSVLGHHPREMEVRPTPDRIYVRRIPVVGWRLWDDDRGASPVLIDHPGHGARVLIPASDGRLIAPDDCSYDSIDEVKEERLACAQAEWDKRHSVKDVAA